MYLPELPDLKNSRRQLRVFGGLNETFGCSEAEYAAGENFSSRDFPALSTRTPRRKLRALANVDGMYHLNGFVLVSGGGLTYIPDSGEEPTVLTGVLSEGKKTLVGLGTRVLIFPDKAAFDTAGGTLKPLGAGLERRRGVGGDGALRRRGQHLHGGQLGHPGTRRPPGRGSVPEGGEPVQPVERRRHSGSIQQFAGAVDGGDPGSLQDPLRRHR